eukprot:SAG31_NODE_3546_length_4100_cov_3.507182_6_plen_150_part_00
MFAGTPFFNVPDPFGTNTGGVHPAMYEVKPDSEFDSWLTFNQDNGEDKEKINSIGIEWEQFNEGKGPLSTSDGAVFLMNPEEIPPFTGELPPEIADKTKRAILLAQLTVNSGSTFTGHVNVQVGLGRCWNTSFRSHMQCDSTERRIVQQ